MHTILSFDRVLFSAINSGSVCSFLDATMPGTSDMTFLALILAIFLAILVYIDRSMRSRVAIIALLISLAITDVTAARVLKPLVGRPRPCHDKTMTGVRLFAKRCGGKFGFPSNHAANSAAVACALIFFYRKLAIPLSLAALTVGFSRIYLGVHFPLDVVSGYILGTVIALLVSIIFHRGAVAPFSAATPPELILMSAKRTRRLDFLEATVEIWHAAPIFGNSLFIP